VPVQLAIVTPERKVVDQSVDSVVLPGIEGEFGVLPGHEAFLSALQPGVVRYRAGSDSSRMAVSTGFAEVTGEHVTLLVRTAELASEIDRDRAEAARDRAQERLGRQEAEIDSVRAQGALARSVARLRTLEG
jgi:F-type H+-transporting ATPase subunit epsilon